MPLIGPKCRIAMHFYDSRMIPMPAEVRRRCRGALNILFLAGDRTRARPDRHAPELTGVKFVMPNNVDGLRLSNILFSSTNAKLTSIVFWQRVASSFRNVRPVGRTRYTRIRNSCFDTFTRVSRSERDRSFIVVRV